MFCLVFLVAAQVMSIEEHSVGGRDVEVFILPPMVSFCSTFNDHFSVSLSYFIMLSLHVNFFLFFFHWVNLIVFSKILSIPFYQMYFSDFFLCSC